MTPRIWHNGARWLLLALLWIGMLAVLPETTRSQEVLSGSVRFVPAGEDAESDVTVSNEVGAVFANQRVKFQFDFSRTSLISSIGVVVVASPVDQPDESPVVLDPAEAPDGLVCEVGVPGTGQFAAVDACDQIALDNDVTRIRIGFNVSVLVAQNEAKVFDLTTVIAFSGGQAQTEPALRLQIAGDVAVDLAIEGPVRLTPDPPRQGDRATLSFFVVNNDAGNPGSLNSLDFDLKPPGNGGFTAMTFLQVGCFVGGERCDRLPMTIQPQERVQVRFQFLSSQLAPTAGEERYLLRIGVNAASRLQEGLTEVSKSNNLFTVIFAVDQPERALAVELLSGPAAVRQGQEAAFAFSITNATPVPLSANRLRLTLTDENGEVVPVEFACALPEALDAAESCDNFSLFIAETLRAEVRVPTDGLAPDARYELTAEATGPEARVDGERSARTVSFVVRAAGDGGALPEVTEGPELRPEELQFVPSATVPAGAKVLLSTRVKNSGNRVAEGIVIAFAFKDDATDAPFVPIGGAQFFPRLAVGKALSAHQTLNTDGLAPGRYRVRVTVSLSDPNTPELDPQNNVLEAIVNVVEPEQAGQGV